MLYYFIFFSFIALFLQAESYRTQDNETDHLLYLRNQENIKVLSTEFKKPDNDHSLYRLIEISNKLQVLLINDPQSKLSAASISISIGHYSDPDDIPGLAHLCEHMLFMGTKKYPEEDGFSSYLKNHSGQFNARTSSEETNFFFHIIPDYFEQALDRFSQFFIAPLFPRTAVEREIHAINAEFKKNQKNEEWNILQLEKSLSNEKSPYHKFGTGNYQTLMDNPKKNGKDILEEVKNFYSKYYSANLMRLVVISKESLDELQRLIIKYFSQIPNRRIQKPQFMEKPFTNKHLGTQCWYKSAKNSIKMTLTFPVESLAISYKKSSFAYLRYLLEHQASNSLYSFLSKKEWILSISTDIEYIVSNVDFFRIILVLTSKGLDESEDLIVAIFQYLDFLRSIGPQEWIFNELKQLDDIFFRFSDYITSFQRASILSKVMQKTYLNYSDLLRSDFFSEYNAQYIIDLLNLLHPNNYLLSISSKTKPGDWNAKEFWYGSEYKLESLPKTLVQKTNNLVTNDLFKLPDLNKYIPENFFIKPPSKNRVDKPRLTYSSHVLRYWYKDDTYSNPKTYLSLFFKIPGYSDTPLQEARLKVYINMLFNSIVGIVYYANIAGYQISIVPHKLGFQLFIYGFNDKILKLLEDVLDAFLNFQPSFSKYNFFKEHLKSNINIDSIEPPKQIKPVAISLYTETYWPYSEILNALESLTFVDIEMFHKMRFFRVFVVALAIGALPSNTPLFIDNYIKNINNSTLYPYQLFDS
ncbi:hypothetical protein PNEG_02412 [Pneumocystis murina B123]|uniref:Peptidase M16 N-terminal domain-containing protein n=1 Tax=Pneumocystis murina (strain B123) TaxID=1069680 RepID=M7P6H0_PNEMU|nr:hypothetical protein PNEG_02412 [Pneumocystis murina B123]EMR09470.1 hypothetical protein PNEG_02412 [Pneumocystis murina B123]